MKNVGFDGVEILDRSPFSMEEATEYPLFTPDLIDLMQRLLSPGQRQEVATVVTLKAHKANQPST